MNLKPIKFYGNDMNMVKRLFITDFDGTLLRDDKQISKKDIENLKRMQKSDVICTIATGRSLYSFNKAVDQIKINSKIPKIPIDYLIFSTGAGVMRLADSRILYSETLESADAEKIVSYFEMRGFDYMMHGDILETHKFGYKKNNGYNPDFEARIHLYQDFATPINSDYTEFNTSTEVLAIIPEGVDASFIEEIQSDLIDYSVIHATSPLDHQSTWIEVFNKNVSKSKTANWLSRYLNIKKKDIISVGNDYNDEDLLDWTAQGYVVGNAPMILKKRFKNVLSNNESGVSHAAELSGFLS